MHHNTVPDLLLLASVMEMVTGFGKEHLVSAPQLSSSPAACSATGYIGVFYHCHVFGSSKPHVSKFHPMYFV